MREKVSWEPDTSFQVIFWLWRLCQGHHDSVVDVYQGPYILASVNDMEMYTRTTLSKFTFSYLWGYWLHYSVHCRFVFFFYFIIEFKFLCYSWCLFCICNALDGWLGNGSYGGTGDQSLLKFFIYSLYSLTLRCMISTYFLFYCWLSFQTHCSVMQSSL